MELRNIADLDYIPITRVLNDWWNGRQMTDMLPRLFFKHFTEISFVIEHNNKIVAFIVGFISQAYPNEAYIHFVGVDPEYRQKNLGRRMYERFFEVVKAKGCNTVRSITSPVNKLSITFHKRMGFQIEPGDLIVDGELINKDYDGPGQDRLLFVKTIV